MSNTDPPKKTALVAAAEFLKYTVAFGTGALVFSAGLVGEKVALPGPASPFLIATWVLLTFSVIAGVLAYSRVPIQLAEESYDLEDKFFIYPGRIHQITFILGIACLGTALIFILKVPAAYKIHSAQQAMNTVKSQLPSDVTLLKVTKLDLIKGLEESKPGLPVWYVQIEAKRIEPIKKDNAAKPVAKGTCKVIEKESGKTVTLDYFIDAKTGEILGTP